MRPLTVSLLFVFITFLLLLELSESGRGRGAGGGKGRGAGGGKGRGGRGRSGSGTPSKSKTGTKKRGLGGSGSKVGKYQPIKATSKTSPVIIRQTKLGSRSNFLTKAVVVYAGIRLYNFGNAPVYRKGYPMYRRDLVSIPEERAIRVLYEEERLLNASGDSCLEQSLSKNYTLREEIDDNLIDTKTTVKYETTGENKTFHNNDTFVLKDIQDENFEVRSLARYNTTIINGTSCMQVEKIVRGTMIRMYETNPNRATAIQINNQLMEAIIALLTVYRLF
ncbi:uncharacterized protein [Montipora capricornis]|uniref:uncharacterized protein n=1 Tax=Montipora capricornis TaxID=246305 RepID=UPI0035F12075